MSTWGGRDFSFESIQETLERTTLGRLKAGDRVNLERSLKLSDRLGGHLVAGHVDGVGRVRERRRWADNVVFRIGMPAVLARYVAGKGSIAVDGISLTVVSAGARDFTVAVIPHTMEATTIGERRVGDAVNLEVDMVARCTWRRLTGRHAANGESAAVPDIAYGVGKKTGLTTVAEFDISTYFRREWHSDV